MKALVIGGDGLIGKCLVRMLREASQDVTWTSRREGSAGVYFDLLYPVSVPPCDVAFLCAAKTRFIECEDHADAYRINVDAPLAIARALKKDGATLVYLSSEAVERALHTNYGMHKALAEVGLQALGNVMIVRLGKTNEMNVMAVCERLISISNTGRAGVHRLCT